ncbi:MAG: hypothetical protein LC130_24960 [Bryobacterales bacterium]|nr:hypothetical protein [Bryobacterales bacterium]
MAGIAANPNAAFITPDRQVRGTLDLSAPSVGADIARNYGWDGAGVDSGVKYWSDPGESWSNDNWPGRIVYQECFYSGCSPAIDNFGHGTHIALAIGGNGKATS